jgi:hypothetical protein
MVYRDDISTVTFKVSGGKEVGKEQNILNKRLVFFIYGLNNELEIGLNIIGEL